MYAGIFVSLTSAERVRFREKQICQLHFASLFIKDRLLRQAPFSTRVSFKVQLLIDPPGEFFFQIYAGTFVALTSAEWVRFRRMQICQLHFCLSFY